MSDEVQAIVIGAGVVGIACARELARSGIETIIIEKNNGIGQETSSRNSEVIHAGIYYQPGSLKSLLCVNGKKLLYRFCKDHSVSYKNCGKIIVSNSEHQDKILENIKFRAEQNNVNDLVNLTKIDVKKIEPHISCKSALYSPSTGIIDSHEFMLSLLADSERYGATLVLNHRVLSIKLNGDGFDLVVFDGKKFKIKSKILINASGLHASDVARVIDGFPEKYVPRYYYAKGNYCSVSGISPFEHLVYPVPEPGGLGVHLTLDMQGRARFGPDVEWVDEIDYSVSDKICERFYKPIRSYWPDLKDGSLVADYSGIRPKLSGQGMPDSDFVIQCPKITGVPGLVNLFGIESPGLTSSLAIAEAVVSCLDM